MLAGDRWAKSWSESRIGVERASQPRSPTRRLLVIVPGSPEAQERLLTLIRQNIDPVGAALAPLGTLAGNPLAEMAGGAPLARSPLAAYALQSWPG